MGMSQSGAYAALFNNRSPDERRSIIEAIRYIDENLDDAVDVELHFGVVWRCQITSKSLHLPGGSFTSPVTAIMSTVTDFIALTPDLLDLTPRSRQMRTGN